MERTVGDVDFIVVTSRNRDANVVTGASDGNVEELSQRGPELVQEGTDYRIPTSRVLRFRKHSRNGGRDSAEVGNGGALMLQSERRSKGWDRQPTRRRDDVGCFGQGLPTQ